MTLAAALARLGDRRDLGEDEAAEVVAHLLGGGATAAQVGALLMGLRVKGECVDEVVGAARALRARMVPVSGAPPGTVDTCGTGGDGAGTFNVSTAAALVVAGAGVPVAKHGNRAVSSRVGSADVLEALGVRLDLAPAALAECLSTVGFVFLLAPAHHPALAAVAGPRRELGVRTLFNLLGPLANPAGVRRQVVGVPAPEMVELLAGALARLGTERAWVVHGAGGLDELALAGTSQVAEVTAAGVRRFSVEPAAVGVAPGSDADLRVGSAAESAAVLRRILTGAPGAGREIVCLNAAAALVVGGAAPDLRAGVARARAALDGGAALQVLERLIAFTGAREGSAG
ncbi:MAG: anthranilate phosphoribosyltransferase [Candidatus Binatia bacterium]